MLGLFFRVFLEWGKLTYSGSHLHLLGSHLNDVFGQIEKCLCSVTLADRDRTDFILDL